MHFRQVSDDRQAEAEAAELARRSAFALPFEDYISNALKFTEHGR